LCRLFSSVDQRKEEMQDLVREIFPGRRERRFGKVVTERHDSSIWNLMAEYISKPSIMVLDPILRNQIW